MGLIRPSTKIWNLKNTEKSVSDKNIKDTLIKKGLLKY